MLFETLPPIPTADQLERQAAWFGSLILTTTFEHERAAILAYGRKLAVGATPTTGQTLRFFDNLKTLAPNLPGYGQVVARMSTRPVDVSRFQCAIARYVAEHS